MGKYIRPQNCEFSDIFGPDLTPCVVALCIKGATTGGSGGRVRTPNFLEDPQLLIQRFCRGVHRQASRVNLVYNTEEERKKKFFLLLLQVLSAFLFHIMALHLAMRIILRLWSTCEQYHIASLNQHRRAWEHSTKGLGCCRASRPCHCNATNNAGVLTEFELSEYRYSCYNC